MVFKEILLNYDGVEMRWEGNKWPENGRVVRIMKPLGHPVVGATPNCLNNND